MAYITTFWDYGLKQEVFKVSGDKGYAHTTDVVLKRLTDSNGNFEPIATEYVNYYTTEFTVSVIRDIGESYIGIYDNGSMMPFEYKTTENGSYTEVDGLLEWSDQMGDIWVRVTLNYDLSHSIQARYLGNNQGLPSQSLAVTVDETRPDSLVPSLTVKYNNQTVTEIVNESDITAKVVFEGDHGVVGKAITMYVDNQYNNAFETDSNGEATFNLNYSVLGDGIHMVKFVFEDDEYYFGTETILAAYMGVKVTLEPVFQKYVRGQKIEFDSIVTDLKDNPIASRSIDLWRETNE